MEKLQSYQGYLGRFHEWRDEVKDNCRNWREGNTVRCWEDVKSVFKNLSSSIYGDEDSSHNDFSHIYR